MYLKRSKREPDAIISSTGLFSFSLYRSGHEWCYRAKGTARGLPNC
jgi:hypothetical protein